MSWSAASSTITADGRAGEDADPATAQHLQLAFAFGPVIRGAPIGAHRSRDPCDVKGPHSAAYRVLGGRWNARFLCGPSGT